VPINVLIADDDGLIREGLKVILDLDERFHVVATVENGRQAVDFCSREKVDVALLDVRMPDMGGLQAAARIAEAGTARPLILTTFDDDELVVEAIKSGARGYLLKNATPDRIKDAIHMVASGGTVMHDVVLDKIRERLASARTHDTAKDGTGRQSGDSRPNGFRADLFSDRELDVIKAISKGLSNREIADQLFMSEGTVKNHITSILSKTGLDHRTQIAIYYLTGVTP